jgi:cytochrome c-type biogenesis protein CcmE
LATDSVEDINQEVDCNNISYSRKAMIRCGMALVLDGTWSVAQLFPHLQEIVAKHDQYFQDQDVPENVRAA